MHLHISNLNKLTTGSDMQTLLAGVGIKRYCAVHHIKNSTTGQVGTFALVDVADNTEMERAIQSLNGTMFGGRKILVQAGN